MRIPSPILRVGLAVLALAILTAPAVIAQDGQQRALARRAAELDAYRKISEAIKGLNISSRTTVEDFVATSDQVEASFDTMIKGIRIMGAPVYHPDGTCEVTVATTIERVVQELQEIRRRHYTGNAYHDHTFKKLVESRQERTISATGYGAPGGGSGSGIRIADAKYPDEIVAPIGFGGNGWVQASAPTKGMPGWYGVTGQGRLMALRAAEADAQRKLVEQIHGMHLSSRTTVEDFVAASDEIRADVEAFTKGIGLVAEPTYHEDGTVEVSMAVTLAQVVEELKRSVLRRRVGHRVEERELLESRTFTRETIVVANGYGAAPRNTQLPGTSFVGWESVNPRVKLMSRRTAEVIAYRRLAERIKGLRVTSDTTVSDFVTGRDMIELTSETTLKDMAEAGETYFYDDGSIQLTFRVPYEVVLQEVLRRTQRGHGPPIPPEQEIRNYRTMRWIVENGYGAVPSRAPYFQASHNPMAGGGGGGGGQPASNVPAWSVKELTVTGAGVPPRDAETSAQARLMAERAAEADAYRRLFEQVAGVKIDSSTTVADFVATNDTVATEIHGILKGARKVATRELPDGTVEVDMTIDLRLIWDVVARHI